MKADVVLIRNGALDDAASVAKVRIDTWRHAYAGIVPADHLASLSYEESTKRMRERFETYTELNRFVLIGESPSGEVVAFTSGGPERTGDRVYRTEVYAIYVLPQYQRQGLGRRLIVEAARKLNQLNLAGMLIWALAASRCRAFYEMLGGQVVRQREVVIGGASLAEVAYGWPSPSLLLPAQV